MGVRAVAGRRSSPGAGFCRQLAVMALVVGGLSGCLFSGGSSPNPRPVLSRFLSTWASHDWKRMAALCQHPPADLRARNVAALTALDASSESYSVASVTTDGTHAKARVTEQIHLALYGPWRVHTTVRLRLVKGHWRVLWSPATINPAFEKDGSYSVTYNWPARAAILASNGTALSPGVPSAVEIGLEGAYIKNQSSLTDALVNAGASSSETASASAAALANPKTFEPVITVSWSRYEQLEAKLYPVPGVFFQAEGGAGSTPADLVGVVGTLGPITKGELKELGPPYDSDSTVGQGGLEQAYQRQLAGSPGATISVADSSSSDTSGTPLRLAQFPSKAGTAVRTTIDPTVEEDASNALEAAPNEAALVAIQASTGKILAVANTSQGSDLALEGEQPPGSTMKVITSTALIDKGLSPSSAASCPSTIDVDGEILHNAEGDGAVSTMLQAFTESCNTAFIGLTMANLGYHSLHDAAATYRIGTNLGIGMPAFSGSVPVNDGQTDLAASAIGQARVVLSPLDLAMVAADLDTSTVRTPWITDGAPAEHAATAALPSKLVSDLHEMMLSVVENGTASGTGLPAGTYAKTGTAEYGTGNPLPIDGWLMGFDGNIAFAMIVVDSPADGGPTDGPIVAHFLDSLGSAK